MSCGVGRRCSSDFMLLFLGHRPVAAALIHPQAWELPYATGVAPKRKKKKWRENDHNFISSFEFLTPDSS